MFEPKEINLELSTTEFRRAISMAPNKDRRINGRGVGLAIGAGCGFGLGWGFGGIGIGGGCGLGIGVGWGIGFGAGSKYINQHFIFRELST